MADKIHSIYKQGNEIKNWIDKTGPIFLKDMKQYLKEDDYNKIYKAYFDVRGSTSVDRIKNYQKFEKLLNEIMFDKATSGMERYKEFIQKNPDKAGKFATDADRQKFTAYETALRFKNSMPSKEHNYESVTLENYVANEGNGYTDDDMRYLAGLYGLDWDNKNDRGEFNKALSKKVQQKKVHDIMHPSFFDDPYGAYANFMLPVATTYAENNMDKLQGDFAQSFNPLKAAKTFKNNPGLGAAVGGDIATNMAMTGAGGAAGKQGLTKAATLAYNYAAAPAIREGSNVLVGNKDVGRGALDFAFGGIGTNIATPKMLNSLTVRPAASAWRWAEGKGAVNKTMQQKVDEVARKAAKTEKDMMQKGQMTAIHMPETNMYIEKEVPMFDKKNRPLYDVVKDPKTGKRVYTQRTNQVKELIDSSPEQTYFTYIGKNGVQDQLSNDEILKLKRGEKLTGNASHVTLEDIISSKEFDEYGLNSPLIRRSLRDNGQKARVKSLYHDRHDQFDLTPERRKFLENSEGFAEYTPYEYGVSTGSIESPSSYLDRRFEDITNASLNGTKGISKGGIAEAFGTGAKNYGMNALGKPEYGGRLATGTMNVVTGMFDPEQRWKYTYGGNEQDAMQGSSQNDLALYVLQYKKHLEEPEYYPEPEDPEGYSKKSVEKLKQSVKSVYGSEK